ncbi:unnamed protein product [Alopecurus aequalis]
MANTISNYNELPSSSSTRQTTKRKPSSEYLDDDVCFRVVLHIVVSLFMLGMFASTASVVWQDRHNVIIAAIAYLYSIIMINLVFVRHRNEEKRQRELEACKRISPPGTGLQAMLTSMLMLVTTGIGILSLGVAVFIFRPNWSDLGIIALMLSGSTFIIFLMLGSKEVNQKKPLRANCDASDRV